MANVLSNLAADIYKAADLVGREIVGVVTSSTINGGSEAAAQGDTVRSAFTRQSTVTTVTPSMTIPEGDDQTVDNKTMTLSSTAAVKIPWTGEDIKHVNNGFGWETLYGDQIKQAMRAICNQIEAAAWAEAYKNASRAFGVAGTTPFGSNFNEVAEIRQILVDNGCPMDGNVSLVLSTTAGTKLRNLAQLQKVNESGGSDLLRQGELLNLQGLSLKESAQIISVAAGSGTGYLVNNAATVLVGGTVIANDTGSGTLLQGDIVTFAADALHKYVANTTLAAGTFNIGAPGILTQAIPDNNAITIGAAATRNIALHRSALEVAVRPIADPPGGDIAVDSMVVQDPRSGLVFEIKAYKGFKKAMFLVSCLYGVKAWKQENIAVLLG